LAISVISLLCKGFLVSFKIVYAISLYEFIIF
jgi:hypothetical protein